MATTEAGPQNVIRGVTGKKKALKQRTNRGYKDFTWMLAWKCYWKLISVLKTGVKTFPAFFSGEKTHISYIHDEQSEHVSLCLWWQNQIFLMSIQDNSSFFCGNKKQYFQWDIRTFPAVFVATELGSFWLDVRTFAAVCDNRTVYFDELSGNFQPLMWRQNLDTFDEKSGNFNCVSCNRTW